MSIDAKIEFEDYTVQEKDTITTISVKRQMSPEALLKINNNITSGLHPGQVIKVYKKPQGSEKEQGEISDAGSIADIATSILKIMHFL